MKTHPWKKVIVISLGIIGGFGIALFVIFWVALNGGLKGTLSGLKSAPDPHSSSLAAKRNEAKTSIENTLQTLDKIGGFTVYPTASHDRCYKGQNNFEVQDGYGHRCTYRETRFYGFNGDFRSKMIGLEQALLKAGWKSDESGGQPLKSIMEDYYDQYRNADPQTLKNFNGRYLVSDMPTPNAYTQDNKVLQMSYAERNTKDLSQLEYAQNITGDTLFETYDKKDFTDIRALFTNVTSDNQFVVALSVQENYFQN